MWFGGSSGPVANAWVPETCKTLWSAASSRCWIVGEWRPESIKRIRLGAQVTMVAGVCDVGMDDLTRMARSGVPDDAPWRWAGSYTVVQAGRQGTTIWTDLGGAWPIYTARLDDTTYWATSSRALAALVGGRVDEDWLSAWLLAPDAPELLRGRSAFSDVRHVPPGHQLLLRSDGHIDARPLWSSRPQSRSHEQHLRAELSAAVRVRVSTAEAPTVDLSGGYDSSALAVLAADCLRPGRAVTAVTVYGQGVEAGGDLAYSRLVAAHADLQHRFLPIDQDLLPYSALTEVPVTDEPAPSTISYARFRAQLLWIREVLGSDCHLTGDGGDSLLCSPPMMLSELVGARRYRRATKEALAWARLRRVSALGLLTSAHRASRTPRAAALLALADALRSSTRRPSAPVHGTVGWIEVAAPPVWATTATREMAANVAEEVSLSVSAAGNCDLTRFILAERIAEVGRTARADAQLAEFNGIALHNPFTDSRVVDTCLAIPLGERPGPAEYKPVLRAALSDLFPDLLKARLTKGSFTSDYYGGLRVNLDALNALTVGHLAERGLINPSALRMTLRLAAAGISSAYTAIEPAIRAEAWLRAVHGADTVRWMRTPSPQEVH